MLTRVEGIYKNGRIELTEQPNNLPEGTKVIITFVQPNEIDLAAHRIDIVQAEALRTNLSTFADDWNSDEMSLYDNYDAAKHNL